MKIKQPTASSIEVYSLSEDQNEEQAAITQLFGQLISGPVFQQATLNAATALSAHLAEMQPQYSEIPDTDLGELLRVQLVEQFAIQVASLLAAEKIAHAYVRENGDPSGANERVNALTRNTMLNVESVLEYMAENSQEAETKQ